MLFAIRLVHRRLPSSGLVGAAFRLGLQRADELRNSIAQWAHGYGVAGFFLVLTGTRLPPASPLGWLFASRQKPPVSGIPHVENQLEHRWSGDPRALPRSSSVGGILAIGSGLVIGPGRPHRAYWRQHRSSARENVPAATNMIPGPFRPAPGRAWPRPLTLPSLAPYSSRRIGRRFRHGCHHRYHRRFHRCYFRCSGLPGTNPDFHIAPLDFPGFGSIPAYLVLGILLGFLGVLYNRAILSALAFSAKLTIDSRGVARCADWCCDRCANLVFTRAGRRRRQNHSTDSVRQRRVFHTRRRASSSFCDWPGLYAARTPGGLFAPLLTIGYPGRPPLRHPLVPLAQCFRPATREFALVGMAALLRRGRARSNYRHHLIVELTGSSNYFLAMLGATFASVTVATLLNDPPIYDSLRELSD